MTPPEQPRVDDADEWHRLSPWMIAVHPIQQLPQLIPLILAILFAGRGAPDLTVIITLIAIPLVTIVPWLVTRYQVTTDHVRVRSGLFTRKVATVRRDRIRSVDLTASLPHRVLGLQKVRIGTGGAKDSTKVELNAIPTADAEALRRYLMTTSAGAATTPAAPDSGPVAPARPPEVLSRLQLSWLRFAPFSLTGLATAAAAVGLMVQFANEAGLFKTGATAAEHYAQRLGDSPLLLVILAATAVVVGGLLSLAGYLLGFWNFTLTRNHDDDTLHVSRGLLTTSVTSLDEHRIRGVHLHEPVLMRPVGGARLHAIATGTSKHPLLLPPAPRTEAVRVGQLVAHDGDELVAPLHQHGRRALRRRLTRALWAGLGIAALVVVGVVGPLTWPFLLLAAAAVIVSATLGVVRYRNLGWALSDRSVVIAPPHVARHRYVVDRTGVVGWATRASWFQRRGQVETVVLATAAGSQAYAAVDIDPSVGTDLMRSVSPDLIAPFVAPGRPH
ncbi:PH domain-containing protein [Gordonia sp. NPDC003424]